MWSNRLVAKYFNQRSSSRRGSNREKDLASDSMMLYCVRYAIWSNSVVTCRERY